MFSILRPGKDRRCPSLIDLCLLDTIGKLFKKILLTMVLCKVGGRGLLRNEQFGFRLKRSPALQLNRLVERFSRNFGQKRLRGAFFFLDVAKTLDTVWVSGLVYKLSP